MDIQGSNSENNAVFDRNISLWLQNKMIWMRLVIKIGGSLSIGEDGPKLEYFKKLIPVIKSLDKKHQLIHPKTYNLHVY